MPQNQFGWDNFMHIGCHANDGFSAIPSVPIQSLLELYVGITDYDTSGVGDPVDEITIPFSPQFKADSQFSLLKTFYGSCERASLTVQFRITSQCPSNEYGAQCTKQCTGVPQKAFCNYLGDAVDICPNGDATDCVCEGNFIEPNCILCDSNYYPTGKCRVLCIPRDNVLGHYTCDPLSGGRICFEGYKDPSTYCVNEDNQGKFFVQYILILHNVNP